MALKEFKDIGTITVAHAGFDNDSYRINLSTGRTSATVQFQLANTVTEMTIQYRTADKDDWKDLQLKANTKLPQLDLRKNSKAQIRLTPVKSDFVEPDNDPAAASGTKSGTIEVSGNGDP